MMQVDTTGADSALMGQAAVVTVGMGMLVRLADHVPAGSPARRALAEACVPLRDALESLPEMEGGAFGVFLDHVAA